MVCSPTPRGMMRSILVSALLPARCFVGSLRGLYRLRAYSGKRGYVHTNGARDAEVGGKV